MLNKDIEYEKKKTYQWREDFFIKKIPRAVGTGNFPFCYVCPRRRRGYICGGSKLKAHRSKPTAHCPLPIAHSPSKLVVS